ncbi:hypothetical protein DPMN_145872 [Dreissena polymorpha]|uniref:Uncharacterized protein n=1 Tax=Dreissena polymorpha TaxID=45954 RepID=A0A9D4FAR6_DREPO|nr:hypothetical protein DPMN_145872 [Dreissena polymorpha]
MDLIFSRYFDPEEPEVLIATRVRDYLVRNEGAEDNESDQGGDVQETGDAHDDAFRNVHIRALAKEEKELNVMTLLKDVDGETTKRGKQRKRARVEFRVAGSAVCKKKIMLFFDIGKHQLLSLQQHVREHGLTPRVHGNRGKKPTHAVCYDDVMRVVHFIRNYADERGLPQPAAPRVVDNAPTVYLTSDTTKTNLHQQYQTSCTEAGSRVIEITAFKEILRMCLPHIRIAGDEVMTKEMYTTIASGKIGPLYFLTLRKVQIFGVQLNFLIDEDQTIGKDGKTSHGPDATLEQLTALDDQSSVTNTAVSYPTWTWRQWKPFLDLYFKPYFRFDQRKPGIVTAKIQHDGEEKELQILKTPTFRFQNVERPHPVSSAGLNADRRQYLRQYVSRYVRPASKDYFFGN